MKSQKLATEIMFIKVLGKIWKLRFAPLISCLGSCDSPTVKGKEIRIDSRLKGEEKLSTVCHEIIHSSAWTMLDEEFVDEFADDLAHILWRLGYRDSGPVK